MGDASAYVSTAAPADVAGWVPIGLHAARCADVHGDERTRSPSQGSGDQLNDRSKGSLLEHIVNHTGSEQCWAPLFVKPDAFAFPGGLGLETVHFDLRVSWFMHLGLASRTLP